MKELTLRQLEVIRAVMLRGTITGAAEHLGVSAPGISRLLRHIETSLDMTLFDRRGGMFVPAVEAEAVFNQIGVIYRGVEGLHSVLSNMRNGDEAKLALATAPLIGHVVAARAMRRVRANWPNLFVDIDMLKTEETADYLLVGKGEVAVMVAEVDNPGLENIEIARAPLVAIVPEAHPLAAREAISVYDLINEAVIGIDPSDPFGAQLAQPFRDAGLDPTFAIEAHFTQTVVSLVREGLGVAVMDIYSVARDPMPGLVRRPLVESTDVRIFAIVRKNHNLSPFAEHAIQSFRTELQCAAMPGSS